MLTNNLNWYFTYKYMLICDPTYIYLVVFFWGGGSGHLETVLLEAGFHGLSSPLEATGKNPFSILCLHAKVNDRSVYCFTCMWSFLYSNLQIAAEISQADGCADCEKLKKEKKKLQRQVRTLKCKVDDLNQKLTLNQSEWAKTFHKLNQSPVKSKQPAGETMS